MKRIYWEIIAKAVGWEKREFYSDKLTQQILAGGDPDYLEMPDDDYNEVMAVYEAKQEAERKLRQTASLNSQGMDFEKAGKIDEAIDVYEQCIALGEKAFHSFERLMVLYHRRKQYADEIRVINRCKDVYETKESGTWLDKRAEKAAKLLEKSQQK